MLIEHSEGLLLRKRAYNSCRSKCSSESCCQLGTSDSNNEDIDGAEVSTNSITSRALFPSNPDTLDTNIVQRFTEGKVTLIFGLSASNDESTSEWIPIRARTKAFDLGLSALCGCTALIVYSENGVYGAHFFEAAAWGLGDDAFQEYVVSFLRNTANGSGGLARFASLLTDGNAQVSAYIMTPQDELPDNPDGSRGGYDLETPLYKDQVDQLRDLLPNIVPGLNNIEISLYQALEGGSGSNGDINPEDAAILTDHARGRVLFQYDPDTSGERRARLFFETETIFDQVLGPS